MSRLGWMPRKCKFGRLKHPKGKRVCRKKRPGRRSRRK